jgi:hypothetical protein
MISEELAFNPSNAIQVFAYEGFQYTISNPNPTFTLQNVSSVGSGLTPESLYFTKNGNISYIFGVSDASSTLTPSSRPESFTLTTVSGSAVLTSSNSVTINGGRFLDGCGNSLSNNAYVFYKNEPIPPITLAAPSFTLKTPTSIPALPPGLSFVRDTSSIFKITGTPSVTIPNSNYQIIGTQQGGSKIVTTRFNMVVSNERLRLDLSGEPIINNMQIDTPITPRVITAIPSAGSSQVRYTFPAFPDGIVVTNLSGIVQSTPFIPTDPSYTFILSGAPTEQAAYAFTRIASGTPEYTVQAARTIPLPIVENAETFSFGFGPTILFDLSGVPPLYTNIAFDPSSIFFRAQTYFTTDTSITDIFSPDLRSDLSLVFVSNEARAYLKGVTDNKATFAGSGIFTISAIDTGLNTRDFPVLINVLDDAVSFSSPVGDICVNYILSRPTSSFKPGYYETPIQFTATANSKLPVTLSAPALSNTGLSLSNGLLTGIPSTIVPLTDLVVTANVTGSPATATKTIKFAIVDDQFEFTDVSASSLDFIQNVQITPFRFPVNTLSERTIVNYSQTGFPSGLAINAAGIVSGTPTSSSPTAGNVTINATTGYATGSRDFSYNLVPDSMIFVVPKTDYTYQAGDSVGNIDINGVTFSGTSVSNYDLSISPTYGMTLNSSTGMLSGTWTTGLPPQLLLPSSCNFAVTAQAGSLSGTLPMSLTANPVVENAMLFVGYGNPSEESDLNSWVYYTTPSNVTSFTEIFQLFSTGPFADIAFKNNDPSNNVVIASSGDGKVFRGTRLDNFQAVVLGSYYYLSSLINITGTSSWRLGARVFLTDGENTYTRAVLVSSEDDGQTWDVVGPEYNGIDAPGVISNENGQNIFTRDNMSDIYTYNPYVNGGLALAYKEGVLMVGGLYNGMDGPVMLRSTDNGSNWLNIEGEFAQECAYINVEDPNVWVATGSSSYKTYENIAPEVDPTSFPPTTTIKYSLDKGQTWFDAEGGFSVFGYELMYANGTWMATGVDSTLDEDYEPGEGDPPDRYFITPSLRYSTNGINWLVADLSTNPLFNPENTDIKSVLAPLRIGSLNFDGTYWNVFVNEQIPEDGRLRLYRHDTLTDLDTNWFAVDISGSFTSGQPVQNSSARFLTLRAPKYLYTGAPPITIQLGINTNIGNGPTFTSPLTDSFFLYQYMPITPIQLSATGIGPVYLYLETADLPPGLVYSRVTNQITGAPVQLGNDTLTIYAQDSNGITTYVLNFTTVVPRVIRKQDGAGAYTSLLRQYTEVLGAQNARDSRVLPNQERALGEFMSPEAPDVITQINGCCEPK